MKAERAQIVRLVMGQAIVSDIPIHGIEAYAELSNLGPVVGFKDDSERFREEIRGQPRFKGLAGPMYGGPGVVRYEEWAVNEMLSR